jgi:hypothetical protein
MSGRGAIGTMKTTYIISCRPNDKHRERDVIEILAFAMWFMPQWMRIAIARRVGEPYFKYGDEENVMWVVGKRTAFLGRAKFTVARP